MVATRRAFGFAKGSPGRTTWPEYLDRLATRGAPNALTNLAIRLQGFDLSLVDQEEAEDDLGR